MKSQGHQAHTVEPALWIVRRPLQLSPTATLPGNLVGGGAPPGVSVSPSVSQVGGVNILGPVNTFSSLSGQEYTWCRMGSQKAPSIGQGTVTTTFFFACRHPPKSTTNKGTENQTPEGRGWEAIKVDEQTGLAQPRKRYRSQNPQLQTELWPEPPES
jgi:hypothetical protein